MSDKCVICGATLENVGIIGHAARHVEDRSLNTKVYRLPTIKDKDWMVYRGYTMKRCPSCQLLYGVK